RGGRNQGHYCPSFRTFGPIGQIKGIIALHFAHLAGAAGIKGIFALIPATWPDHPAFLPPHAPAPA
ncbi:hypothetical protein, partial [Paenibacillus sp. DMB5]|uniref:hypothetical protein n=1 Tax=Paenibacillus sp. DMB5 TaxID=1780103 RepID=UPI001A7E07F9